MPDLPFPVAGDPMRPAFKPARQSSAAIPAQPAPTGRGSRRRRLWELSHKCHCSIVGVCFGVAELRALVARVANVPRGIGDFVLHTSAVAACESRSPLSELLHKRLENRFQLAVRRFAAARDGAALQALWAEALADGTGIPGALWAAWSHPACDKEVEQAIYGDIHMLQHQVGSGTRADLGTLQALQHDNRQFRRRLDEAQRENDALRTEKARETARLADRIGELRSDLAGKEAWAAKLAGQLEALRQSLPDLRDRQALVRRATDAEARAHALTARAASLEGDLTRLTRRYEALAEASSPGTACRGEACPPLAAEDLQGKCVLCVGGRSGAVEAYRQLVEGHGGSFLHHDGGLEESLHRIDAAVAAADLVVCQAGCISHNAYWRVKEQCKRCLYLKTAGVSTFARAVAFAAGETED